MRPTSWRLDGELRAHTYAGLMDGICDIICRICMDCDRVDAVRIRKNDSEIGRGRLVEALWEDSRYRKSFIQSGGIRLATEVFAVEGDILMLRIGREDIDLEYIRKASKFTHEPDLVAVRAGECYRIEDLVKAALEKG